MPATPTVLLCEQQQNVDEFYDNFPTRNYDHFIFLIKTGNAHEEKMLP